MGKPSGVVERLHARRERLIQRLNRTSNRSEDAALRRRLADEHEAFAYAVASAALFDALGRRLLDEQDE